MDKDIIATGTDGREAVPCAMNGRFSYLFHAILGSDSCRQVIAVAGMVRLKQGR